ncbi:SGNH/GDSL hydrolase family protein [Candidatus Moduliflexota bacterium]
MYRRLRALCVLVAVLLTASCSSGPSGPSIDLNDKVIVAFGNSITAGVGDRSRPPGYPYKLELILIGSWPNAIVLNRGVAGERTYQGAVRINRVLARDNPDYVLIMEGINNVGQTSLSSVIWDLESMVASVKAAGAIPLLASLTPTTGPHEAKMPGIEALNPMIRNLADREKIVFVDQFRAFMNTLDFTTLLDSDGLHPNTAGYQLMAETWYQGLLQL